MASVKPKGPGKWLLRWRAPDPLTGQSVERSRQFTGGRADALREANRIEAEQRGDPVSLQRGKTFGAYLTEDWLPYRDDLPGVGQKVKHRDREIVTVLCRLIGSVPLAALDTRNLDNLAVALARQGYAPRTCAHYWGVARKALKQARRWRLIAGEPWVEARAPSVPRAAPTITTVEDAERIAVRLDGYNPIAAALVRVMLGTGCRKSELLALAWDDVSEACDQLSIHKGVWEAGNRYAVKLSPKNAASRRVVALPAATRQTLRAYRDWLQTRRAALPGWNPDGWVFPNLAGRLWRPSGATITISRAARRLGLPTGVHILRHTHATTLLESNVPVKAVSERLGHASAVQTLNTYAHVTQRSRDEALAALDERLPMPGTKEANNVMRFGSRQNTAGSSEPRFVDRAADQSSIRRKRSH
jgi:integrase